MGKLSLWKPNKNKDYKFIDKHVRQAINVGGTTIYVHRYTGPKVDAGNTDPTIPNYTNPTETTIQDVLLLENRDRKYAPDIIEIKGVYNINDLEFNLSQFGIFLAGDTLFLSFHINEMVERVGRKIMSGDVIELVHRRDDLLLDPNLPAINAFYVVKDASRSAEGYSATWYAHLWRVKAEPITDSPEYADILNQDSGAGDGTTIKDAISQGNRIDEILDLINAAANKDVNSRNMNSDHFFIQTGNKTPGDNLQMWVFNGNEIPMNTNEAAPSGTRFPTGAVNGDYFVRTDYSPPRLFKRDDNRWSAVEIDYTKPWTPAHRELENFLDDTKITVLDDCTNDTVPERQPITKVVSPRAEIPKPDDTP